MGRELTRRHAVLFEKKGVKHLASLFEDLSQYQKWSELVSFMVWEFFHQLRLFPRSQYLLFDQSQAIALDQERMKSVEFSEKIINFFRSKDLVATRIQPNWKKLFITNTGEIYGIQYPDDQELVRSTDQGETSSFVYRFPERIKSIYVSSQNDIFVCVKGAVYKSSDRGVSFLKKLGLGSSESYFRHNNAITEMPDHTLWIAEYGNVWEKRGWRKLAYLYSSQDRGETWQRSDFLIHQGTNKHVHLIKYSPSLNRLLMADGDNKKKLYISQEINPEFDPDSVRWKPANKFHIQMGGYTSIVENDARIYFGTDYQGGTNFIVETSDGENFSKRVVPDPYRRSPIDNMVLRRSKKGTEIWANLPYSTPRTRCLLMYTNDGGKTWKKVFEYSRATHKVWLLSSSSDGADVVFISVENTLDNTRLVYKISDRS